MDIFYTLLTLTLMGASYAVGLGRGRWGDKRVKLLGYTKCGCGHGNNYHRNGGKTTCAWEGWSEKYNSNMECACRQFTPKIEDN